MPSKDQILGAVERAKLVESKDSITCPWLEAVGFKRIHSEQHNGAWCYSAVIDDFEGTADCARSELVLAHWPGLDDGEQPEWTTDVLQYSEDGSEEGFVALTGSWCYCKGDLLRLGRALNLRDWRL